MHENRETSMVPDTVTGRSGKAYGRTPDMHAAEESDFGVVPVNQPNKSGKPQAEVGEGRPGVKENIAQSITGQSTPCSGLSTLAVPYHREVATWDIHSLDRQSPRSLAHFSLTTSATSSGCS